MTKEMAKQLLESKDVYLTSAGRELLLDLVHEGTEGKISLNVSELYFIRNS